MTIFHFFPLFTFCFVLYLHSVNFYFIVFFFETKLFLVAFILFCFWLLYLKHLLCFTRPLFLLSWCHDLKTRCDPNQHIESYYIFDLSISMFCDISCPHLLKYRAIPHVPSNISTTYQFVSTKYSRNKTDMRVNIHYEIALLRYNTLKKFWGKNLRGLGIYASFSPPAPHSRYTFNELKITNELIPVLKKRVSRSNCVYCRSLSHSKLHCSFLLKDNLAFFFHLLLADKTILFTPEANKVIANCMWKTCAKSYTESKDEINL